MTQNTEQEMVSITIHTAIPKEAYEAYEYMLSSIDEGKQPDLREVLVVEGLQVVARKMLTMEMLTKMLEL